MGILEAKNYGTTDMVSLFMAAIVDRCCINVDTVSVTDSYTPYVDLVDFSFRRRKVPCWTEAN